MEGAPRRFAVPFVVLLAGLAVCAPASAATISVTTPTDGFATDGQCSLREAIHAANGDAPADGCTPGDALGTDTISLPGGTYTLTSGASDDTNAAGDLDIDSNVALVGAGAATTIIDANQQDRVLDVLTGTVSISGVTVTDGLAKNGAGGTAGVNNGMGGTGGHGGGIRNVDGSLTLTNVTVTGNTAGNGGVGALSSSATTAGMGGLGGSGGGVWSSGPALTIMGSTISLNKAGTGAVGGTNTDTGLAGQGGHGGSGGGVAGDLLGTYALFTFAITNSTISDNDAGNAGAGGPSTANPGTDGNGGSGGAGGGVLLSASSSGSFGSLSGVTLTGNDSGKGGDAGGVEGKAGPGGAGGGLVFTRATIQDLVVSGNRAGDGGAGGGAIEGKGGDGGGIAGYDTTAARLTVTGNTSGAGGPSGGNGGVGGGISVGGTGTIAASTVSGNATGAGGDSAIGPAGVGGAGSGIALGTDTTVTNTTVAGNTTGAGGSYTALTGCPNYYSGARSGPGAVVVANQTATLTHVTVAGNSTGPGGSGMCNGTPQPALEGSSRGGIVVGNAGTMTLSNAIVANNTAGPAVNCTAEEGGTPGTLVDGGGNVWYPQAEPTDTDCPGILADPKLGPLANNGGPTQTMALLAGSAALDIAVAAQCLTTDQRGSSRPLGSGCDAGAYESDQSLGTTTGGTNTDTTPTQSETTPTTQAPSPAADTTAPAVRLRLRRQRLLRALRRGFAAAFTTNEAGSARGTLFLRRTRVAAGRLSMAAPGTFRLVAKFTRRAKRALGKRRRVRLRLVLVVADGAGNRTSKTAFVTLRR